MLICRDARDTYSFDLDLFHQDGHYIPENYHSARRFALLMSKNRKIPVPASDINALGLLDEVLSHLLARYILQNPGILTGSLEYLKTKLGGKFDQTLVSYVDEFPNLDVYTGQLNPQEYLSREAMNAEKAVQNILITSIANANPAIKQYQELRDDTSLKHNTSYTEVLSLLGDYFSHQPGLSVGNSGKGSTLLELLAEPVKASPHSIEGQLKFILERWSDLLTDEIKQRLLRAMDFIREDVIRRTGHSQTSPEATLPNYQGEPEYERYSQDREWMPRLVLIAKNSYVWLEQLSRKYLRWIRTLDQIPDEELELLASRGFTGLWLIGLWERSRASQRIKQRIGDADAVASAYSLNSYDIAVDLGGWEGLQNLRSRAWRHGIRLSADMVPNHMGIDSEWVIQHPDWFLSLPYPPYPSYSFSSENLSDDSRVGIHLEDHYYNHSDAAVVFQRRDHWTGDVRYIYHGNDGTSFPWNDTAQLDYTKSEVREAVIQTILHVARNFPIIRFDAAMTLARKHIQRLWFPEPGGGGAIPSRAEHGMTRNEFDRNVPNEFWREVVDRIAAEVPDTLLLAEAFWLMEGYFVRTLGMHRVYNSAFMHMLRDEANAKYRQLIKITLEFDPQILKRYVNFMSNPDEKTANEQFGTGDKYFGICTLLSTLPGLPMFGHGQIEGFHEKYGMEFRKPKWDEQPDEGSIQGHGWRIFPLLYKRYLFAEVEFFNLFDFYNSDGFVNEDVFAYSNRSGEDRGLVIYHNKFAETRGWIRNSAAVLDKASGRIAQTSLGDALMLPHEGFAIFRDYVTHLEYIRLCSDIVEKGMYAELGAYQCHVFMDWRFVTGGEWAQVSDSLKGVGVESVERVRQELAGESKRGQQPDIEFRENDISIQVDTRKGSRKRSQKKSTTEHKNL